MAGNCAYCGKQYKMFESGSDFFFNDSKKRTVCLDCLAKLQGTIGPEVKELLKNGKSKKDTIEEVKKKYAMTSFGAEYVADYADTVIDAIKVEIRRAEREKAAKIEAEYVAAEKEEIRTRIQSQLLTTGYSFEGYKIVEYKKIVSGEIVIGTGMFSEFLAATSDFFGTQSNEFAGKMREIKDAAIEKIKIQSALAGGNAVIGVDFDYVNFSNNMIGISVNGTSVVIEKKPKKKELERV